MYNLKKLLLGSCAIALLAIGTNASAQDGENTNDSAKKAENIVKGETIVVRGQINYRDRSREIVPTLQYNQEYFQNFEPLTVGDALKRVPSVTFLSDVIEADGVRLRGLSPAYSQILINGERVPGSEADRSFWVDRIPAELIKSVEIVRSSTARRTGDAMAGTININLRDAYALDGGYVRAGISHFNDDKILGNLGLVWGGSFGTGRLLLGLNAQGRRNPKEKFSYRYDAPLSDGGKFVDREDQTDLRNGKDYSFNANYNTPFLGGELDLGLFYVKTDREQLERSFEMNVENGGEFVPIGQTGILGNLISDNKQDVSIKQDNYSLNAKYKKEVLGGKMKFGIGYASFKEDVNDQESEVKFSKPSFSSELTITDKKDEELNSKISYEREISNGMKYEFGYEYNKKNRDILILSNEIKPKLNASARVYDIKTMTPLKFATIPFGNMEAISGGDSEIEETRNELFLAFDGKNNSFEYEFGARYAMTDVSLFDKTVDADLANSKNDYSFFLPSASIRYNLSKSDRILASVAKTIRRPSFDMISPALLETEYGDNDFIGNTKLKPETAIGFDIGYERKIGKRGIMGINFFYRDVSDLIEIYNTGQEGSEGEDTFVLSARNLGNGKVKGIEIDYSSPLDFIGLPNTGLFLNYSWLDSEVRDEFGKRLFNDQSDYVMNIGIVHEIPSIAMSFGATYRKQGDAFSRLVGEEVSTSYSGELEAFVEKSFGKNMTLRFVGSNLLNSEKAETFHKFTTIADQINRNYDEYENEKETAGAVYQLVLRYAF